MHRIQDAVEAITAVFRDAESKHEAHRRAAPIMEQLTREPAFLTAVLAKYLSTPLSLTRKNYPVVGLEIAINPWLALVANCWIPLPGRETHIATKAIHHHGDMLLTTATLFGPGYEHWMFSRPTPIDEARGTYRMDLLESAPHPAQHVSFVDAGIAHTPFYPRELSITLALWSSRFSTTWLDRVKRIPVLRRNADVPKKLAAKLGLARALDLKVVASYDFFPVEAGFQVMPERKEFELGPNEDHLYSVFSIVQQTGNEHLARVIRRNVAARTPTPTLTRLLADLERGASIEGRLSAGHYDLPYANFTREDVHRALRAQDKKKVSDGSELTSAPSREAAPGAAAH